MQALTQSAFLQALGYAIANSLWQVAIIWFVVMSVNGIFKLSATGRYRVALTGQLAGFTWFVFTLVYYFQASSLALAEVQQLQTHAARPLIISPNAENLESGMLSLIVQAEQLLPYLSCAYLMLFFFLLAKWIRSYRYTAMIQTQGLHKIDVEWKLFVKRIAAEMGIKAEVKIYLSELVNSPLTIGFLKPVILIPVASMNNLTVQQLEAIVLHELAHIRRFDYVVNLAVSIIELCLFFNPFTQLLSRIIRHERENSCDDWVLQYQYQPAMYAEALLRLAYLQASPALAMTAVKNRNELLVRVKRMLEKNQRRFNYRQHLVALLLMTGILSSLAWLQPGKQRSETRSMTARQPVVIEPLAAKVDNPLFNPVFFLSEPLKKEVHKAAAEAGKALAGVTKALEAHNLSPEAPPAPPTPASVPLLAAERMADQHAASMRRHLLNARDHLKNHMSHLRVMNAADLASLSRLAVDSAMLATQVQHAFADAPLVVNLRQLEAEAARATQELQRFRQHAAMELSQKKLDTEVFQLLEKVPEFTRLLAPAEWKNPGEPELRKRAAQHRELEEKTRKLREEHLRRAVKTDSLRKYVVTGQLVRTAQGARPAAVYLRAAKAMPEPPEPMQVFVEHRFFTTVTTWVAPETPVGPEEPGAPGVVTVMGRAATALKRNPPQPPSPPRGQEPPCNEVKTITVKGKKITLVQEAGEPGIVEF